MNKKILTLVFGMILIVGLATAGITSMLSKDIVISINDKAILDNANITDYKLVVEDLGYKTLVTLEPFGIGDTIVHKYTKCDVDEKEGTSNCYEAEMTQTEIDARVLEIEQESLARIIKWEEVKEDRKIADKEVTEVTLKIDKVVVIAK